MKIIQKLQRQFCTITPKIYQETVNTDLQQSVSLQEMQKSRIYREQYFADRTRIKFIAGHGGSGCISHYRDRTVKTGASDGGNGGKGGDVILKATNFFTDLNIFRKKEIQGNRGRGGGGQKKCGKEGSNIHISVPLGTLVYEILQEKRQALQNEIEPQKRKNINFYKKFLIDLSVNGQEYTIVKGGKGGKGNGFFNGINVQEMGGPGQQKDVFLELKTIADVGLVGFPNVGKSTILAAVSRSLPKIANYPFTTLSPMVGKIKFVDNFDFSICDIPGIIEDSHKNKGLGLEFLRHIERTKILVFVVDIMEEYPWKQLEILRKELLMYKPDFLDRPACVVANKSDIDAQAEEKFNKLQQYTEYKCFLSSAKHFDGLSPLIMHLRQEIIKIREENNFQ